MGTFRKQREVRSIHRAVSRKSALVQRSAKPLYLTEHLGQAHNSNFGQINLELQISRRFDQRRELTPTKNKRPTVEGNSDERKPSNVDDNKAWDSANEHLFSVLRLTAAGAA